MAEHESAGRALGNTTPAYATHASSQSDFHRPPGLQWDPPSFRHESSDEELIVLHGRHHNDAGDVTSNITPDAQDADSAWPIDTQNTRKSPYAAKTVDMYTAAIESLDRLLDDEHYNGDLEQAIAVDDALLQLKTWRWEDGCDEDLEKLQDWQCMRLAKALIKVSDAAIEILGFGSGESSE